MNELFTIKKLRICRNIQTLTKNWYNFNLNY